MFQNTGVAQPQQKLVHKRSRPQMTEVQRKALLFDQGLPPVEEAKEAADLKSQAFDAALKGLEGIRRVREDVYGRTRPEVPKSPPGNQSSASPGENKPTHLIRQEFPTPSRRERKASHPRARTNDSPSSGSSAPVSPMTQHSFATSSRSSGSPREGGAPFPKDRSGNMQSSGTRRSDQDIEMETTRPRGLRKKTLANKESKEGLGLSGM